LRIVRRIAAEHGGSFALRAGAGATEAVLELPLEPAGERR
jgi:signal transduction histidine kinase